MIAYGLAFFAGVVIGWFYCAMFGAAKRADECEECLRRRMDAEAYKTRRRNQSTRSAVVPTAADPLGAERSPLLSNCCSAAISVIDDRLTCEGCGKILSPLPTNSKGDGTPAPGMSALNAVALPGGTPVTSGKLTGAILHPAPFPPQVSNPSCGKRAPRVGTPGGVQLSGSGGQ